MKQAIVSYLSSIDVSNELHNIERELKKVNGFARILNTFYQDNAVIAEVEDDLIDEWILKVRVQDNVDYCVKNYQLKLFSFQGPASNNKTESQEDNLTALRQHHRMGNVRSAIGTKIGIVDTGFSAHPYLPSLDFSSTLKRKDYWHDLVRDDIDVKSCISRLASKEVTVQEGEREKFNFWAKGELDELKIKLWKKTQEHTRNRRNRYATHKDYLLDSGFLGLINRVSLDSRNFTDCGSEFDLTDSDGHGTAMASLLTGSNVIYEEVEKHCLLPETLTLSTHSELVVLKVYESDSDDTRGDLLNLLKALDYTTSINLDVLYIGIGFVEKDASYKQIKPLERRLDSLTKDGCIVVCPAGNTSSTGLTFPAALESTTTVTSVNFSNTTFQLNTHSSYADEGEKVSFCAFGGDDTTTPPKSVLCASNSYGFSYKIGTSVAGAIAASIIATYKSQEILHKNIQNAGLYVNEPNISEYISKVCSNNIDYKFVLDKLNSEAYSSNERHFYGKGLIRYPLDDY
ncbi:hypothetical protein D8X80_15425 [Vibrio parahaemolyticus]|nr:hypothetical protein [Vibrio parahaemolyticus]